MLHGLSPICSCILLLCNPGEHIYTLPCASAHVRSAPEEHSFRCPVRFSRGGLAWAEGGMAWRAEVDIRVEGDVWWLHLVPHVSAVMALDLVP